MKKICVLTALVLGLAGSAQAAPIGPTYPAPGGNSFSSVGLAANTGGATRSYGAFDSSAWSELYFGFTNVSGPLGDNTSQTLQYAGFDGTNYVWQSTTNWTFNTTNAGVQSTPVLFKASFWDAANTTSINGSVVTGASVGIAGAPIVLQMDAATLSGWGGGFTVRAAFTTLAGTAINSFYNQFSTPCSAASSTCVQSGTSGAFYSLAPVPEPASLLLFGTGLLGVARSVRRRFIA